MFSCHCHNWIIVIPQKTHTKQCWMPLKPTQIAIFGDQVHYHIRSYKVSLKCTGREAHTRPLVQLHDAVLFKIGIWLWFHVSRISFVPGTSPLGRAEQTLRTTQRDSWKHTHSGYTSFTLNPALSAQLQGSLGCCSPQLETERYNAWVSLHTGF